MDSNDKLTEFINGLGALAEAMRVAYDSFIKAGFNDEQSLYLCGQLLQTFGKIRGER